MDVSDGTRTETFLRDGRVQKGVWRQTRKDITYGFGLLLHLNFPPTGYLSETLRTFVLGPDTFYFLFDVLRYTLQHRWPDFWTV